MRQINLMPPELAAKRRARQITGILIAAGGGLIALLVVIYIAKAAQLSNEKSKLSRQQEANADLQRQVDALKQFSDRKEELANKQKILTTLTADEVRWSVLLNDIAIMIPRDAWLSNLNGTITAATAASAAAPRITPGVAPFAVGQIQFTGCALNQITGRLTAASQLYGDHLTVVEFLVKMSQIKEFTYPYLTLSSLDGKLPTDPPGQCPVQFNSSVLLSDSARRSNQNGAERKP